jgi:hypothetical protein
MIPIPAGWFLPEGHFRLPAGRGYAGKIHGFPWDPVEDPCNSLVMNFRLTGKAIHRKIWEG